MQTGFFSILSLPVSAINGIPDIAGTYEFKLPRKMSDEEFFEFCSLNPELRIEQDENGKLIIMPPVGFDSGYYEDEISGELRNWRKSKKNGLTLSSSTGFKLPDGSTRCPDAAWVNKDKIASLTKEQRKTFAPVVPDFVVEVRSSSDKLDDLKDKMENTWIKNGVRLAWLVDPIEEKAYIYRSGKSEETVPDFEQVLSGEDVCVGFELDLRELKEG
jgi:Uma2 family endonuclease